MELVKKLFTENIESIDSFKSLSGGLSNEIYLINERYIWKIFKNKYLFNHENEKDIIKNSNKLELFYSDSNNICYNFIPGNNISKNYFVNNLNNVICLCKEYHKNNLNIPNFWNEILPKWLDLIPEKGIFCKKTELLNIYQNIDNEINIIPNIQNDIVLCHHDIHSRNIVNNKDKLELIDLEFSFNNYYFVDLGNIICEIFTDYDNEIYEYNLIDDSIIKKVLKLYDKNITPDNIKKIKIGIQISHFYWCIWGILVDLKENKDFFDYKKFSMNRYKYLLN